MKLVVDANILFSFFKRDSTTRNLLTSFELLELYTPALGFSELVKNKADICRKAVISDAPLSFEFGILDLFGFWYLDFGISGRDCWERTRMMLQQ
jgi:predicted nucleic acid-binding protein